MSDNYYFITSHTTRPYMTAIQQNHFIALDHPIEYLSDIRTMTESIDKKSHVSDCKTIITNILPLKGDERPKEKS